MVVEEQGLHSMVLQGHVVTSVELTVEHVRRELDLLSYRLGQECLVLQHVIVEIVSCAFKRSYVHGSNIFQIDCPFHH